MIIRDGTPKPPVPVYRLNDTAAPGSGQFLEVPFTEVTVRNFEESSLDALELISKKKKEAQNLSIEFTIYDYIENRAPKLVGAARTIKKTAYLQYNQLNDDCPTEDTP